MICEEDICKVDAQCAFLSSSWQSIILTKYYVTICDVKNHVMSILCLPNMML
jgi:hypothetical protein